MIALNYAADDVFRSFVPGWIGSNQTWIVKSLEPSGITLDDRPVGFGG